jgi:hypothetical protein
MHEWIQPPSRDPTARRLYTDHLAFMLGRTNTLTGQRYAADPAVYGYDVLNEPRCACPPPRSARLPCVPLHGAGWHSAHTLLTHSFATRLPQLPWLRLFCAV